MWQSYISTTFRTKCERQVILISPYYDDISDVILKYVRPLKTLSLPTPPKAKMTLLKPFAHSSLRTKTINQYDHNDHTILRRMSLRRDSLRIHSGTSYDASLSLLRLPATQRRVRFRLSSSCRRKLSSSCKAHFASHASPSQMDGKTHRGFCPEYGSPIQAKSDSVPRVVAIRAASLDDPSWFNLQVDVWTSDAQPWDQMTPALLKFEKYPSFGDSADPAAL
jgi:hypothetical protein